MAEIRSVSVHLDADVASYIAKMRLAGAETDKAFGRSEHGISTTNTNLKATETQLGKVSTAERRLATDISNTSSKVDRGARDIDRYGGRLGLLGDALLALGPALVPIGAVAVPTVAALGGELVFVAGAAGVAKLAFVGVGGALTALNKAVLQPTAENLKAARLELDQLPPPARAFVFELQAMRPELDKLRASAAGGLLPGADQGLHALLGDLPIFRHDIRAISGELGVLARDTGRSLSSDRWRPFLRFVGREAPAGLDSMGRSIGAVAHGLASLGIAFTPFTHELQNGILAVAQDFDHWASSVGKTRDFKSFLQYVDANGPKVLDLLGNTAQTFLDISRAAAPLGGPVLDSLNAILHVVDAVAQSDLGTPLFAGIVAMRLLTRGTQLWGQVSATSAGQFISGQKAAVSAIASTVTAQERATLSATQLAARETATGRGWSTLGKGALKAGAGAAGFALIASGLTDKLHLTNTATLALAGSMAGPWGAAVGAGVGMVLDFKAAQDRARETISQVSATLDQQTGAVTENTREWAYNTLASAGAYDKAAALGISLNLVTQASLGNKAALAEVNDELAKFQSTAGSGARVGDTADAQLLYDILNGTNGVLKDARAEWERHQAALGQDSVKARENAKAHQLLEQRMQAVRAAAREEGKQFLTFGDNLDDAKVSLDRWIHSLAAQAQALTEFGNNARRAADKGLRDGLIKQLEEAGPAGALRMRQLANASQQEIAKANHAWDAGRRGLNNLADAAAYVTNNPANLTINGVPQSISQIRAVQSALRAIQDKVVHITTIRATGGQVRPGLAEGGTVPGPRTPYGDKVLIHAAPGEQVISNRHGQADRFRADRAAGRIPSYADGGTVTHVTTNQPGLYAGDSGLGAAAAGAGHELRRLQGSLQDATKELDVERQHRQALVQQRQQLVSSVRDTFRSDIFGVSPDGGVWATGATSDPARILRQNIRDARAYSQDIRRLRRRGLRGGALAQVTTLADAQQALGLSAREDRELSRLFGVRQRASQAAGARAGDIRFGQQIAEQTQAVKAQAADVHHLNVQIRETNHRLAAIEKATKHDGPKAVGDAINGAVRNGARRSPK